MVQPYAPLSEDEPDVGIAENVTSTPASHNLTTYSPNTSSPTPTPSDIHQPPCQWILYTEIHDSRVRIWDLIILIPNALFLLFLLLRLRVTIVKLKHSNSPIFFAFYGLVSTVAVISVLRCVVSMTVNAAATAGDIADKVLWLVLRFFLLATELSVVVFGLAFGHLDSKTSIRRVLIVTFTIALIYSVTQGVLEFLYAEDVFHVKNGDREYDIFGHGGMKFWFATSVFFFVIYTVICILPWTQFRRHFALPTKKSFYVYIVFLASLNAAQAVGSALIYCGIQQGMCVVDVTTYIYFTCFAPLVYGTFLRDFFRSSQPSSILFSYKAHIDDEEDNVSLPHQTYAPQKADSDPPSDDMYDSTTIDGPSPNPLYHASHDLPPIGLNPELSINVDYFADDDRENDRVIII